VYAVPLTDAAAWQTPAYPPSLNSNTSTFAPPGLVRKVDLGSTLSFDTDPYPVKAIEDLFEEHVTIALSPSQDRQLYGLENDQSPDPEAMVQPWEQGSLYAAENLWDNVAPSEGNLWGENEITKGPAPDVILCPVHGKICKKGICQEMSKIIKAQERLKATEEKNAKKSGKGNGVLALP
jgi:hypothetical protein